jgi:hypothetical protein
MPKNTFVEIPTEEQAWMLATLRRARYGYLLALHILLLCAAGRNPTEIAAVLFCSRSSVYRTVMLHRKRTLAWEPDDHGRSALRAHYRAGPPAARCWSARRLPGLWLVPHALELCAWPPRSSRQTGVGLGRDDAPLAP